MSSLLGWGGRPRPPGAQRRLLQAQRPAATVRGLPGVARCITATCLLVAVGVPSVAADVDWANVERQATEFLSAYVQIDTTNPPGNEITAAQFLADRFRQAGIDAETFEAAPGRGSVLARLKGSGGGRPVILLNHLDVVPANPDGWDVPPFSGTVRDGYVYGRGALDCKGVGTVDAMVVLLLKQHGITLKRDVIFLGTADEETGGKLGAGWMVDRHFDRFADAQFVLNEGGAIEVLPNGKRAYGVAVAEKTPCWLRLTATGRPGHGSAPDKQTAVTRLVRALERSRVYRPALRVTPEVQAYYAALAPLQEDARRKQYTDLRGALQNPKFRAAFLDKPHDSALVHNTITPTVLTGSQKTNVIPRTASAELDCRLLPGESPETFVTTIRGVIDDPDVNVDVLLNFPPAASPTDTPLYAALRRIAEREHVPVIPSVLTGFTDSHYFREKGITSYGFVPFALTEDEGSREHGINERLSTENLRESTRRLLELLQSLDEVAPDGPQGHQG
jgi:acetylornithine deacetylase/succinyl-diaminopimelate desuccinylase-like protein